jgi:hypothetical protein
MYESVQMASHLCEVCAAIDFPTYFQPPSPEEVSSKNHVGEEVYKVKVLGLRADIRRKSKGCAFCNLVCEATRMGLDKSADSATIRLSSLCCARNEYDVFTDAAYAVRITQVPSRNGSLGLIQILADDAQLLGLPRLFHARVPTSTGFDMGQARTWLNICRTRHGLSCESLGGELNETAPQPLDLLAVDLINMSICCMPLGSDYVALSYCWPAISYLTLNSGNRGELFKHQALLRNHDMLPGTIQDAISCAQELPFRYLWIDALCIMQDDIGHKTEQLRQMDRVYGCASLTIVAAYPVARGSIDPCDGLPGYKGHILARNRSIVNAQSVRMMPASPASDHALFSTRWDTRCWTFQERYLSRRLLCFTPSQVYFQCSCNTYCEDVVCEDVSPTAYTAHDYPLWNGKSRFTTSKSALNWGGWELSRKPLRALSHMWGSYEMALDYYTHRHLSYPSDILNAFEGIKAVLCDAMQTDFWQGMPEKIMAQALCWQSQGSFSRRRNMPFGQPPSEPLFPSWSWAGWEGPINLNTFIPVDAYRSDAE